MSHSIRKMFNIFSIISVIFVNIIEKTMKIIVAAYFISLFVVDSTNQTEAI